jgi:hypothetical protein
MKETYLPTGTIFRDPAEDRSTCAVVTEIPLLSLTLDNEIFRVGKGFQKLNDVSPFLYNFLLHEIITFGLLSEVTNVKVFKVLVFIILEVEVQCYRAFTALAVWTCLLATVAFSLVMRVMVRVVGMMGN